MLIPAVVPTGFRVKRLGDCYGRGVLESFSLESGEPGSGCAGFQSLNPE